MYLTCTAELSSWMHAGQQVLACHPCPIPLGGDAMVLAHCNYMPHARSQVISPWTLLSSC